MRPDHLLARVFAVLQHAPIPRLPGLRARTAYPLAGRVRRWTGRLARLWRRRRAWRLRRHCSFSLPRAVQSSLVTNGGSPERKPRQEEPALCRSSAVTRLRIPGPGHWAGPLSGAVDCSWPVLPPSWTSFRRSRASCARWPRRWPTRSSISRRSRRACRPTTASSTPTRCGTVRITCSNCLLTVGCLRAIDVPA